MPHNARGAVSVGLMFLCAVSTVLSGCGAADPAPGSEKVIVLTDATFEAETTQGVALVDFWATWCGPCDDQAPIVAALAEEYDGKVLVGKLDVDENPKTAERFGVSAIPTLIVFRDGKVVRTLVGLQGKAQLAAAIDAALAR